MLKTVSSITNAIGALNYKGTWNASTNTPTLASGVGTKGDYYVVSVAGSTTLDGISNWGVGDWAAYNGSVWQRVEGGADGNFVNLSVSSTSTLSGLTASTALALDASKNVVSVTNTGTGDNVLATSPTLVTPALGAATATSLVSSGTAASSFTVTSGSAVPLTITNVGTGNSFVVEDSASTDSSPFVIDANGVVVQGYTVAVNNWNGAPDKIQSHTTASNALPSVGLFNWSSNTGRSASFNLYKSVSNTIGTQGIVANLQQLGRFTFSGDDGATFIRGAEIDAFVDGTPGLNDMPGGLRFSTTADGAATPTERMRINSAGNVGIGSTANASAILDAQSTTKGVRMPNMTTAQKNAIVSPAAGLIVFDTTLAKLAVYSGAAWQTITSV